MFSKSTAKFLKSPNNISEVPTNIIRKSAKKSKSIQMLNFALRNIIKGTLTTPQLYNIIYIISKLI